jgi:hypothetical protein
VVKTAQKKYSLTYAEVLYHVFTELPRLGCKFCKTETEFVSIDIGYRGYCSSACSNSDPDKKAKSVDTFIANCGYENISQSPVAKEKKRLTCLKNHGVDHPQQSAKVRKLTGKNNLRKYGHKNVSSVKEFQDNRTATMIERYGSENAMGNAELRHLAASRGAASRGRLKEYTLGKRVVGVRGYEPQALNWLLANTKLSPSSICVDTEGTVPRFNYYHEGDQHTYYPDFYIPKQNRVVEVKCIWTFLKTSRELLRIKRKRNSAITDGYSFTFMLMDEKGVRFKLPTHWPTLKRTALLKFLRDTYDCNIQKFMQYKPRDLQS